MIKTENVGIRDMCIDCGHYHYTLFDAKHPRKCTTGPASGGDCKCIKFVSKGFKHHA